MAKMKPRGRRRRKSAKRCNGRAAQTAECLAFGGCSDDRQAGGQFGRRDATAANNARPGSQAQIRPSNTAHPRTLGIPVQAELVLARVRIAQVRSLQGHATPVHVKLLVDLTIRHGSVDAKSVVHLDRTGPSWRIGIPQAAPLGIALERAEKASRLLNLMRHAESVQPSKATRTTEAPFRCAISSNSQNGMANFRPRRRSTRTRKRTSSRKPCEPSWSIAD